jgi:hypothetical protein
MPYTFPDLGGAAASIDDWKETRAYDPTNRTQTDGGYAVTAPRTTRTPVPKRWHLRYGPLTDTTKGYLETMEDSVGVGSGSITWTNPRTSASHTVRLLSPITFTLVELYWRAEFDIEEV